MDPKTEELGTDEEIETPEKTPTKLVEGSEEVGKIKKQLSESSAEGIRLAKENKILIDEKKKLAEEKEQLKTELEGYQSSGEIPLDENELARKHPDWDILGESEKSRIRQTERVELRQKKLDSDIRKERQERIKAEEERRFEEKFRKVLSTHPELVGKEEEFKEFCYRDDNLGNTNLDVLAKSFLFDKVKEDEEEKARNKGEGLESGTAGEKKAKPKDGYTPEEARALMESNPRKYAEMIRDGKLKILK